MDSCKHELVAHRVDTVPLFEEETMPIDVWECSFCGQAFRPIRRPWQERFAEWREVKRFARSVRRFRQ